MSVNYKLAHQVKTNLTYYSKWTLVQEHKLQFDDGSEEIVLSGVPSAKLEAEDGNNQHEWVVCTGTELKTLALEQIQRWFEAISRYQKKPVTRLTVGIVNDDATVVYYFIHEGVVQPRQN